MKRRILLSWSSGKDSAWALHVLRQRPDIEVVGLFCTINEVFGRVAMHAVRTELLAQQAERTGLPLQTIPIPHPCKNAQYRAIMERFVAQANREGIQCFAFGDLFLEDIRRYREDSLAGTGITPLFPLWGIPTDELSETMVMSGLRARITCIDPEQLGTDFIGRDYDAAFLEDIPEHVDPCGENGEFHSFVYDGPIFSRPVEVRVGETLSRDGFLFADLLPKAGSTKTCIESEFG